MKLIAVKIGSKRHLELIRLRCRTHHEDGVITWMEVNRGENPKTAKQIVDALTEQQLRTYLTCVIEALYCHEADGELDLDKEWSSDELDEIGRLLEPLVNS